jgi:hypothetical protein
MKKPQALSGMLVLLLAAICAACHQDEAKLIDVPRKDIPKEILNKPIPPEAFKTMSPAMRQQVKKMEETVNKDAGKGSNFEQ